LRDSHRGRDHAEFRGLDRTELLKSFPCPLDYISGVVTQSMIMCEYERTEMLLRALRKKLSRKAIVTLDLNPAEPSMFDYG